MGRNSTLCLGSSMLLITLLFFSSLFAQTTIFQPGDAPANPHINDGQAVEVGVKFRSSQRGFINAIRYYKTPGTTGTHTGHLWASTGTMLAEIVFTNETSNGWQRAQLASPVPIEAGITYVASCHSASGDYAVTNPFFTEAVQNGPLRALAHGEDGPNGVYIYSATPAFPANNFQTSNYWIDVEFSEDNSPAPLSKQSVYPADGATGVSVQTVATALFNQPVDASTVNYMTFMLKDGNNNPILAAIFVNGNELALAPAFPLLRSTVYSVYVKGGPDGVKSVDGGILPNDVIWSFTTADPTPLHPTDGPGGPILVISNTNNPFSRYAVEILRAEGLNEFAAEDISAVSPAMLNNYDVAILGEMEITTEQSTLLTDWVNAGGTLIAFRPSSQLSSLFGIVKTPGELSDKYLLVNTSSGPGQGIVNETMQYHGASDLYSLNDATSLAALYFDATTISPYHTITTRNVGPLGGKAIAFSFDLARSVVYTRQGNPAWAGVERDGLAPVRTDDMFFGNAANDPQPNWIDFNKVAIPQADEQQRLLANIILQSNLHRKPLPRFWYLPRSLKAAIVMTGDDHANNGTAGRFNQYLTLGPNTPQDVIDWKAVRGTSYIYPGTDMTNEETMNYQAQGFEIALHPTNNCGNYTSGSFLDTLNSQLAKLASSLPGIASPVSSRNHCLVWSDWASVAKMQVLKGIRLDVNYYNWPESWMQNIPGMFTGSGMPMRFADLDGSLIDGYQVPTQMTDETNMNYTSFSNALLDKALGAEGYYGIFCANMHTDQAFSQGSNDIIATAQAHGIPVISAKQALTWLDGRNNSSFGSVSWNDNALSFIIVARSGARNLKAMVPVYAENVTLASITRNGNEIPFTTETIKGIAYAFFDAPLGSNSYVAYYHSAAPVVVLHPSPQIVCAGKTAVFKSTASGYPAPVVQWQESVDGQNWTAISGATDSMLVFITAITDNGKQYRAAWTNSHGTSFSSPALLTVNPVPSLSTSLTASVTSGSLFNYMPASTVPGTAFTWSRATVAGISNGAIDGTGNIGETLINTTNAPVNVTYLYKLTANGCMNTQFLVVTVNPPAPGGCEMDISIASNFNSSSIPANRYIWFNSVFDPNGLGTSGTVNFYVTDATIRFTANGQQYVLAVPNSHIRLSSSSSTTSTAFLNNSWEIQAPLNTSGNIFLGGLSYRVPANLPGSISNVTWSAKVTSDKPGVSLVWKWAAAVYTNFANNTGLDIKPVDGPIQLLNVNLTDKAGTPLNYKLYVVSGATGGGVLSVGLISVGLLNYTGNYSQTATASCTLIAQTGRSSSAANGGVLPIEERRLENTEGKDIDLRIMPNPSSAYFKLVVGTIQEGPATIRITDVSGRVIERYEKIIPGAVLKIGERWRSGTYMAEIVQDGRRKVIKLIKVN